MMSFRYDDDNRRDFIVIDDSEYPEGYEEAEPFLKYFSHFDFIIVNRRNTGAKLNIQKNYGMKRKSAKDAEKSIRNGILNRVNKRKYPTNDSLNDNSKSNKKSKRE